MPALQAEEIEFINADSDTTVKDGDTETVNIKPPVGYIYEGLRIRLSVTGVGAGTDHIFQVRSETHHINLLSVTNTAGTAIVFSYGYASSASTAHPTTEAAQCQMIRGIRIDEDNGLDILYTNNQGADQTNTRLIRLWVRKLKVA